MKNDEGGSVPRRDVARPRRRFYQTDGVAIPGEDKAVDLKWRALIAPIDGQGLVERGPSRAGTNLEVGPIARTADQADRKDRKEKERERGDVFSAYFVVKKELWRGMLSE